MFQLRNMIPNLSMVYQQGQIVPVAGLMSYTATELHLTPERLGSAAHTKECQRIVIT